MTDYSRIKLTLKKSPKDERDFKFRAFYAPVDLPRIVDHRPLLLPVRDQEDTSECAAFAGSEFQQARDTKEIGLKEYLSPQFIYNHREDTNEEGMYIRDLMKILQNKGVCLERLYTFRSQYAPSDDAYENALNHRSNNYASIDVLSELKQALYVKGPCIIAVPVYNFTERMWYQHAGEEFMGGHAMLCAGYNDDTQTLLILNSWGSSFGEDGYVEMSYEDFGLAWEWWSAIDLPSENTTTNSPETTIDNNTTTTAPESWFDKNWLWVALGLGLIGVALALIF